MKPQPARQRPLTRHEQLWAAARDLASGDGGHRWELEPPAAVLERRRAALPQCEGSPFSTEEQQWLLDTPCKEVLNQVHVKEVGGSTKAAQAAAAVAQQRRPAGPHRLVTWRHIHTGDALSVEVPLSVFRKQRGAVFRKWQQRAWRALHTLRCEVGPDVWPDGCREAAAAGAPSWDDLEEETAALAKLPFCMPQKCKVQLLGLGTIKRFKAEVLGKRKDGDRCETAAADGADKQAQHRMRAALWMGQEWLLSPPHEDSRCSQPQLQQQELLPGEWPGQPADQQALQDQLAQAPAPSQQPATPHRLQQRHSTPESVGPGWQEQRDLRCALKQQRQKLGPAGGCQAPLDCTTPTAVQEQTSCLTALFDDVAVAVTGDGSADGTSPMRSPFVQLSTQELPQHAGGTPSASVAVGTPSSRHPHADMPFGTADNHAATPAGTSLLWGDAEERSPVSSLKELFHQCTSQGGAAGSRQPSAPPEGYLPRNSSSGSLASGLECCPQLGLPKSIHASSAGGGAAADAAHRELPDGADADRMLLRIGSQGSSSGGFGGFEPGPAVLVQEVNRHSRADTPDAHLCGTKVPPPPHSAEAGRAGIAPCPAGGQQWLRHDGQRGVPDGPSAKGWLPLEADALPAGTRVAAAHAGSRDVPQPLPEQPATRRGAAAGPAGWAGAADWLLQWSDARAGKAGPWQAGGAGRADPPPPPAAQPRSGGTQFCFESSLDLLLQGCPLGGPAWQSKGSPVLEELLQACSPGGAEGGTAFPHEASLGPWLPGSNDGPEQQQQQQQQQQKTASQDGAQAARMATLKRLLMAAAAAVVQGDCLPGMRPAGPAAAASWQDSFARLLQEVGQLDAVCTAGTAAAAQRFGASPSQHAQALGSHGTTHYTSLPNPQDQGGSENPSRRVAGHSMQTPARRKWAQTCPNDFMSDTEFNDILDQLFSS